MVKFTFRIPDDLHEALRLAAFKAKRKSMNDIATAALAEYLEQQGYFNPEETQGEDQKQEQSG